MRLRLALVRLTWPQRWVPAPSLVEIIEAIARKTNFTDLNDLEGVEAVLATFQDWKLNRGLERVH